MVSRGFSLSYDPLGASARPWANLPRMKQPAQGCEYLAGRSRAWGFPEFVDVSECACMMPMFIVRQLHA